MIRQNVEQSSLGSRGWPALLAVTVFAALLYFVSVPKNPPGFFIDESSISYNAYTISQTGRDEFGVPWPLFFSAFGEYKNPVYIYLLAAVFRLTGPSIVVARIFSALIGLMTAFILGLLAERISRRRTIGLIAALTVLLTPWLFELSRVAFEVAMYPLTVALFLLCVRRAAEKPIWSLSDVAGLVATLALLSYTYSVGRLFAPLMALGLVLFASRARLHSLLLTWTGYVLTIVPALLFQNRHPDALTNRFQFITYITSKRAYADIAWDFAKHYVGNLNPYRLFVSEHSKVSEIIHIPGAPPVLLATAVLAVVGTYLVIRHKRREAWWRFILYGLAASVVPASLTNESFHMLRLAAFPVFLIVLTVPAVSWLAEERSQLRRVAFITVMILTLLQGAFFQYRYHRSGQTPQRLHLFDAEYQRRIFEPALARNPDLIYLADLAGVPGYIQAYWYATLRGFAVQRLSRLPAEVTPPAGALVITTEQKCLGCEVLGSVEPYTLYVAHGTPRVHAPLPNHAFRARIEVTEPQVTLQSGQKKSITVRVKNMSDVTWLARDRAAGRYQVRLGNHWLDSNGKALSNDDARSDLSTDLGPGEETTLLLTVTAPIDAGEYLLELDMLQEEVSWFGLKGSPTVRLRTRVE